VVVSSSSSGNGTSDATQQIDPHRLGTKKKLVFYVCSISFMVDGASTLGAQGKFHGLLRLALVVEDTLQSTFDRYTSLVSEMSTQRIRIRTLFYMEYTSGDCRLLSSQGIPA
jgi:hypothetical protein